MNNTKYNHTTDDGSSSSRILHKIIISFTAAYALGAVHLAWLLLMPPCCTSCSCRQHQQYKTTSSVTSSGLV